MPTVALMNISYQLCCYSFTGENVDQHVQVTACVHTIQPVSSWDSEGERRETCPAVLVFEPPPLVFQTLYGTFVINPADVGSVQSSSASWFISLRCHLCVGLMVLECRGAVCLAATAGRSQKTAAPPSSRLPKQSAASHALPAPTKKTR